MSRFATTHSSISNKLLSYNDKTPRPVKPLSFIVFSFERDKLYHHLSKLLGSLNSRTFNGVSCHRPVEEDQRREGDKDAATRPLLG